MAKTLTPNCVHNLEKLRDRAMTQLEQAYDILLKNGQAVTYTEPHNIQCPNCIGYGTLVLRRDEETGSLIFRDYGCAHWSPLSCCTDVIGLCHAADYLLCEAKKF